MRVLLLGASGFIGSEIARALLARGHEITGLGRDLAYGRRLLPAVDWRPGDLRDLQDDKDWLPLLEGMDVVINASGVLQDGLRDDVVKVQLGAIGALIAACAARPLRNFIQISASNADPDGLSPFMATKGKADRLLAGSDLPCTVLRPGLVIGRNAFGGTEMLRMAASLPFVGPRLRGAGQVRCVAMTDLVDAVVKAAEHPESAQGSFDLVEMDGRPLDSVIALHRRWLGLANARLHPTIPLGAIRPLSLAADLAGWLGWRSPLRSASIAALANGVTGDGEQAARLLGRQPLALPEIFAAMPAAGKADRWHAASALAYPLALLSLFVMFAASGWLGLRNLDEAASLLQVNGMDAATSSLLVAVSSVADLILAMLLILRRMTRLALTGMLLLSAGYLAGSLIFVPFLWADPLGPMIKVLPALALMLLCLAMANER